MNRGWDRQQATGNSEESEMRFCTLFPIPCTLRWLAKKLARYLAPLIAAEVARQLSQQQPAPPEPQKRKYIGE